MAAQADGSWDGLAKQFERQQAQALEYAKQFQNAVGDIEFKVVE
jgi:hypothetical protein